MDVNIIPVVDALGQCFTSQHDVDESKVLVDERVGGRHLLAEHALDEIRLDLVHRIHAGHALDVEGGEFGRRCRPHIAVETGRWQERETLDACVGQLSVPVAWNRIGVAEDMEPINRGFACALGPVRGGDEGHIPVEQVG